MHRQVSGADRKSEVVVGGSINLRAEQFRDRKEGIEITGQSCSREKGKVKRKGDLFTFLLLAKTSKLFYIFRFRYAQFNIIYSWNKLLIQCQIMKRASIIIHYKY